ncbi:MAG: alpha/beta fold hydrolase, partial [Bdellovibrionia bacterium]
MKSARRLLVISAGTVVVLVLLVYSLLYFNQAKIIFFPGPGTEARSFGDPVSEHFLETSEGKINYLVFSKSQPAGIILYFHGNAGDLGDWGHVGAELARATDQEIWIMDYPGFGKTGGDLPSKSEELERMAKSFVDEVNRVRPGLPVIVFGRSIGTGIASAVAALPSVTGVILETPYLSLRELAGDLYPWIPGFLLKFNFDNTELADLNPAKPVLVIHGT